MAAARVAAPAAAEPEVVIMDSDEDEVVQPLPRASSGQGAGPSRQQQHAAAQRRGGGGAGSSRGGGEAEVIDLTGDEPVPPPRPRDGDLQIVSSTVQRAARAPTRGVKRPRGALAPPLSPVKQRLLQNLLAPPPPPPPEPEPEGPKCGICMEPMGGSHERAMASGNCGHVYCYDCLVEAVRAQKKCPTCRKNMQLRQIHKVFLQFS